MFGEDLVQVMKEKKGKNSIPNLYVNIYIYIDPTRGV